MAVKCLRNKLLNEAFSAIFEADFAEMWPLLKHTRNGDQETFKTSLERVIFNERGKEGHSRIG